MSIVPTLRCPCRGQFCAEVASYDAPPAGETPFDLGGQVYRRAYDRCAVCDHWFGRHDLDLTTLYDRAYVDTPYGGPDGMRRRFEKIMSLPAQQSDNRQRVHRINTFARERGGTSGGRLLDVGAGLGVFPAAMAAAGWDVTALEPDVRTVAHLIDVAGVKARAADLLTLDPSVVGVFDVITFNKVLEHVEDPVALLGAASRLLKPEGFVYIEVPDVAAIAEGHGREEFFLEHHHVFSPASLTMLAQRAGLLPTEVERVREPSGKYTVRLMAVRP